MNCKRIIYSLLFIWSSLSSVTGQEFINRVIRTYKISNATSIDVFNKYGKLHVMTWERDSVRFIIDIIIRNKDVAKLEKIKNSISFEFTPAVSYVIAKTQISSGTSDAFKDLMDIAGSYFSSQNQITIDYTIMVPSYSSLRLENKFGDVYIDDREGNLDLILSYGDFKANTLSGNCSIKVSSGDAEINSLHDGHVTLSYSNLHILNAQELTIESRSSNIIIDEISDLTLRSRRDKLTLPRVRVMKGDSYFSEFSLLGLQRELNYIFRYGSLTVDNIEKGFSSINIQSEYTDLRLSFVRGSAYDLEITHHQDALFSYPHSLGTLNVKQIDKPDKQKVTYGRIGTAQSDSRVTILAPKKCIISIIHK
ncbi:MAG: hypothetical protein JXR41_15835 [Bacteroidales bacterium]|nr:hypothetical protein [Bacteroidales bacterium]MBN2764566.1 hypothetical protein [Bacteroidales bacterium]